MRGRLALLEGGTLRPYRTSLNIACTLQIHGRRDVLANRGNGSGLAYSFLKDHSPVSMQIYAHARNVRYRGQLEALEPGRRGERVKSFSEAAGLPKEVIDAFLANRRKIDTDRQLSDAGEELLFTGAAIKDLKRAAKKLGATESERMQTLMRIRTSMAKKRRADGGQKIDPHSGPKRITEKTSNAERKKRR
jgi:hypothetical protein